MGMGVTPFAGAFPGLTLKAWALISTAGATFTFIKGANIAGGGRTSSGLYSITFTTPLTSVNYMTDGAADFGAPGSVQNTGAGKLVGSCQVTTLNSAGAASDPGLFYVAFYE